MHSPSLRLNAALDYARRGWRVVPLHTPTQEPERPCSCGLPLAENGQPQCKVGKHPRIREWPETASTDETQIRHWWGMWPEANIGIACGAGTGWWALDSDGDEGLVTLAKLEAANSPLPPTVEQVTGGGGSHRLFLYVPGLKNAVKFAPGLDVRTDGGLIVVEPSLHECGREYAWNAEAHPDEVFLAEAPGWLLTAIKKAAGKERVAVGSGGAGPILQGARNDTLFRDGCAMRRRGMSEATIRAALWQENEERCQPPLPTADIDRLAASSARYAPGEAEATKNGSVPHEEEHGPSPPSASAEEWEDPVPISAFDLPPFPVDVLPGWVRDMVEATAESLAVPLDACAMFTQACLATAVQKRVEAVIRPDWREPLSQWVVIVLPPANRKSQFFRRLLVPIVAYEHEQGELMKPEIATAAAEQRILQGRLKKKEEEAYKAKTEFLQDQAEREAIKLATRLENLKVPAKPRLLVNDATPEKLGMLLAENGSRMAVMSPEGDVFEMMAGRYSNGVANLGLYLAGHSGDDHTVDRVSRESIHLTATALTFGLTVQPDILAGFANKPQFRGRGLLGRFLYSMPESLLGTRPALTPTIPTAILDRYDRNLTSLLKMPADKGADGGPRPHDLFFDDEAAAEMAAVHEWIEPRMKPWGDLRYLADWVGKLVGQTARSAALLRVATCADTGTPWSIPVDGETVAGARRISEYLIPHAQAAFQSMGMDEAREGARHILGWLKSHPCSRFLRRNLHRRLIRTFEKVESMEEPLSILVEAGYLRTVEADGSTRPGPKGMEFLVHPRFGGQGGPLEG